jgi:hypothetical protein
MFEVKRSEAVKVVIYGEEFALKKPSVKMIEAYAIDIDKASKAEQFARAKTLLTEMGLTQELVENLEFDHLQDLIEFLTSSMAKAAKKN